MSILLYGAAPENLINNAAGIRLEREVTQAAGIFFAVSDFKRGYIHDRHLIFIIIA